VPDVYKSSRGRAAVRRWCSDALARAGFPLTTATVDTSAGRVALVSAGREGPRVVMVPGTGFNGCCVPQPGTLAPCSGCSSLPVRTRPRPKWSGWPWWPPVAALPWPRRRCQPDCWPAGPAGPA